MKTITGTIAKLFLAVAGLFGQQHATVIQPAPAADIPAPAPPVDPVALSDKWRLADEPIAPGRDGRVIFTYGSLATVTCAPLRICVIELQPGEHVSAEPHIGDAVRWDISPAAVGSDQTLIVIKPKLPGLETNMLITTDRRAYYVRLVSDAEKYVARTAFEYPDDVRQEWRRMEAQQKEQAAKRTFARRVDGPINRAYRVKGDALLKPVLVYDDGTRTTLHMAPGASSREAPVLFIHGPQGDEITNYRVVGDLYVVDRLFDRARLVLGVGKHARHVEIERTAKEPS